MRIRILIVDDETLARARVRKALADETDVEIVGECADGPTALEFIQDHHPDLVFLDVQMPEVSGFDVLRALPSEKWPAVIFVTAHDHYALEAFEVHAVDYLLKPFKESRFRQAMQHVRQHLENRDNSETNHRFQLWLQAQEQNSGYPTRLTVRSGERSVFIAVDEVDYIEADSNYAILHVGATNHVLRETLTSLEARLSPKTFLRVNRSAIVNLRRVKAVQPAMRGDHVVVLQNGKELPLTCGVREIQHRLEFL
ncbi:MAG TPA: response regulator transcription factor [Verrucomicrobiota bacterium]|jgi:two-component system LytT family response regulator|nr:response regulator transcription factor [Verrucomicrobiota bacterium]HQL77344.1 response regulator transcription factor [Verrucomicrobiota bacterium]